MNSETVEKLREYKQLVEEGILTQEEFEKEKKQLLSNKPEFETDGQSRGRVTGIRQENSQQYSEPLRTIHVPLLYRTIVMNENTPKGVVKKCDSYIIRSKVFSCIGAVLLLLFIYKCFASGFWAVFAAFFWALCPGITLLLLGISSKNKYTELRDKFVDLTQSEFEYVQKNIQSKRADEKEAVITFANEFANAYQQQTGGNIWYDTGEYIGRRLSGND